MASPSIVANAFSASPLRDSILERSALDIGMAVVAIPFL